MERKWDTVIPPDLKRLFVSETHMSHWSRKGYVMIFKLAKALCLFIMFIYNKVFGCEHCT